MFKTKFHSDGSIDKYKARLVVKGYAQTEGIDYEETFSPTAKYKTICCVLVLCAQQSWPLFQMDAKSVFLNGELSEEIYVEQPPVLFTQDMKTKFACSGKHFMV